jgi:putative spermidine/putrescine transport system ATP-binding protein
VTAATPASTNGPAIELRDLHKAFGPVRAVDGIDLRIGDGEFFSMLGPSGSGKTTVLRIIAGFEEPTSGQVLLAGDDVTGRPPFVRDVNTVFQDYALFPHMSVAVNVEYGLRVKKVPRAERRERVQQALETVRLGEYGERKPTQLSGGQRQRVALARAIVNRPKVLLLDEPLGALDLKLRREMQIELKQMQRELGITFVFVTHDQEEALTMSDRIAVFNDGRIEQVATPEELYERPATPFVAGFVGTSNMLEGALAERIVGEAGTFSVRPEKIRVDRPGSPADGAERCTAEGVVQEVAYLGSSTHAIVGLDAAGDDTTLTVQQQNADHAGGSTLLRRGERVQLSWPRSHLVRLAATGAPSPSGSPTEEERS